jgi:DNA-binding GntR family transcriptional regulator
MGILKTVGRAEPSVTRKLRDHIRMERDAIAEGDVGARSYLLGDFHVCMVEALGNRLLADILRDLAARTVLISALYQSQHDATESCNDHECITNAIAAQDFDRAATLMIAHIGSVEAGLTKRLDSDPLQDLRLALRARPRDGESNGGRHRNVLPE